MRNEINSIQDTPPFGGKTNLILNLFFPQLSSLVKSRLVFFIPYSNGFYVNQSV